jgi:hypothetical protein
MTPLSRRRELLSAFTGTLSAIDRNRCPQSPECCPHSPESAKRKQGSSCQQECQSGFVHGRAP